MDAADDARGPRARPALLRRAGWVVSLQGAALAALGAGYAASGVLGRPEDRLGTVLAGLFALAVGAGLVPIGTALGRGRGGALAPTVVLEVMVLVVASGLLQGGVLYVAVPMVVVAAFVLYALTAPATRDVFRGAA